MTTTNDLREDVQQQISLGFSKQEIEQNLLLKGYEKAEVKETLAHVKTTAGSGGGVSATNILVGILFIGIAFVRLAKFASGGSIFLGFGVLTAIGLAIYRFTNND